MKSTYHTTNCAFFLDNKVDMFMSNKLKMISSKEFINHVLDNQAIYVTHVGRYPPYYMAVT
jgi:hypothetical protein